MKWKASQYTNFIFLSDTLFYCGHILVLIFPFFLTYAQMVDPSGLR